MAITTNWNLTKPTRGALYWDTPLNANFDLIDTILYNLRTNYASTTQPTEKADIGSFWFDTLNNYLKIKYASGYEEVLTKAKADILYFKKTDTFSITQLYWYDSITNNMAKIFFNTSKMLEFQFGNTPGSDKIIFKWLGTDGTYDVLNIFSNKVVFSKNIEIPSGTTANHAINKAQADLAYLSKVTYTASDILTKLKTVDGTNSGLDADTLDGNHSSVFANKSTVDTALALINATLTTGTVNNADKVDGFHAASFLLLSNLLTEIKKVDGNNSGLDADLLDGHHYSELTEIPGVIKIWSTTSPPAGYLECNGAEVSRTIYSALFAEIGTTHGAGDGSTTFNLPDLRGVFVRGWDHGKGVDPQVNGRVFGTVQLDTFATHNHFTIYSAGNSTSNVSTTTPVSVHSNTNSEEEYSLNGIIGSTANIGPTSNAGNSTETRPINVALMYIIKI